MVRVIVITKSGTTQEDIELDRQLAAYDGTVIEDAELHQSMNVFCTPYCILLDEDNQVSARGVVSTLDQIEDLVEVEIFVPRASRVTEEEIVHQYLAPGR